MKIKKTEQTTEREVTEIIELAIDQLDLLTRSFDLIAQIADNGKLQIVTVSDSARETLN